jgi:hypothetical protein
MKGLKMLEFKNKMGCNQALWEQICGCLWACCCIQRIKNLKTPLQKRLNCAKTFLVFTIVG